MHSVQPQPLPVQAALPGLAGRSFSISDSGDLPLPCPSLSAFRDLLVPGAAESKAVPCKYRRLLCLPETAESGSRGWQLAAKLGARATWQGLVSWIWQMCSRRTKHLTLVIWRGIQHTDFYWILDFSFRSINRVYKYQWININQKC